MITVTEVASGKMKEILQEEDQAEKGIRIFVEGGGCSGFQYGFAFDDAKEADFKLEMPGGFEVLVDAFSMNYLKGATVDYVETLEASGFKITNPNATGTCGCGQSFDS
ncbi:MAG: iron-sulfur cluster insertion protein ErpA [Gemmatimonadota bacterium]|jgi:iron-sulfur cluster insertion protein|nr:iron-sulfur cluster insertion protein ErpA [Gemmatimonadota bacterium]MDP6460733.1 iron-sulfur cluster insertion protein ErpA [Gemmatimonadota bacterium]MDP6529671.1 iron-sulfur cluster insertion protein ErpA [Gemmatimonadota bacterium]MDP6802458.1 iron-sulfur cluster insertion protein ErpA [Gemmatimonadota bacterium]MDP7030986.1 iron-sulfur cluster insertion protein ErpA [Gemmatimonadota bacterium]